MIVVRSDCGEGEPWARLASQSSVGMRMNWTRDAVAEESFAEFQF